MPVNILNLSAFNITGIEENEYDYHIDAEVKDHPSKCQNCDSDNIVGFGRTQRADYPRPANARKAGRHRGGEFNP